MHIHGKAAAEQEPFHFSQLRGCRVGLLKCDGTFGLEISNIRTAWEHDCMDQGGIETMVVNQSKSTGDRDGEGW